MAAAAAKTAAKVRYIGRRTKNFGRPLLELLLNLKDFGAGRLVVRTYHEKFPEPTYYRILSVEPHVFEYPANFSGTIIVEPTFRGRVLPPEDLAPKAHYDDYRLLHKHEEEAFKNKGPKYVEPRHILPRYAPLPPVWVELFKKQKGRELTEEESRVKMLYHEEGFYRIAEEDEKPSFETGPGHFRTDHMSLYEGVVWTRQPKETEKKS